MSEGAVFRPIQHIKTKAGLWRKNIASALPICDFASKICTNLPLQENGGDAMVDAIAQV